MYGKRNKKRDSGSLVYTGKKDIETKITLIEYDRDNFSQKIIEKCPEFPDKDTTKWIKINRFSKENLNEIGRCFNLDQLVLEDIINTRQRPKMEDYQNYLYIVLKLINVEAEDEISTKQISLILQKNVLISFQDEDDIFDVIVNKLKFKETQMRTRGADYLLFSLVDTVIYSYFNGLERLEDRMVDIEEGIIANPDPKVLNIIHNIKMDITIFKNAILPVRDIISNFGSYNQDLINKSTDYYIRDVYNHSILVFEMLESLRDRISDILDIYLSSTSNKLNEIVRVLTVISTVFVPLTFIVGFYGMNFKYMYELGHPLGYPLTILGIFLIAVIMLVYFRRKKWL